ncbi:hypothetical protein [Phenylobacterium sp.]|uniref:hypothetical protein n=1 Tax=Phenylobacterium sp. TaxID=1871053 RepID=UPI0011F78FF1|nr:hypothetical protein [Phenylobacterium sp.]THD59294.1 MAG: hypothetical protein E8A49_16940 [Phenylobacterium sp.]
MYTLLVYHPGEKAARATIKVPKAADVLTTIPEVLAEHHTCEHVVVMLDDIRLFAVDCVGNRLP